MMMNLTLTMTATVALPTALIIFNHLTPSNFQDSEKLSPYECGFTPLENARLPFSLQFFLIAIFFLLFDLEIALLLPVPWGFNNSTLMWMLSLIILLTLGLLYEWSQGALDWAK